MKKLLPLFLFILAVSFSGNLQAQIHEDFETSDSTLPAGWSRFNEAGFPISADPDVNWVVRDSGSYAPGLASAFTQSHNSLRSVGISWWASLDTNSGGGAPIADCWMITPQFTPTAAWKIKFWASGGSTNYSDSMQVWISLIDSLPPSFSVYLTTIHWPIGSTYGNWTEYTLDIPSGLENIPMYVGFRYYMDCTVDGFFVYVDDVDIADPTSVNQISSNVPEKYSLSQNYPNPFNPTTNIKFDIAKNTNVKLIVFNNLGQEVATLVSENLTVGEYAYDFNASRLSSGIYFYTLRGENFVETKKMMLIK